MNLLIVDDHKEIVQGMLDGIPFLSYGIDSVLGVCSVSDAKAAMEERNINILLTDIEMPGEDGLSLVRWTKAKYPDIVCIFLTSHAQFDYAQEAVELGITRYILQPAKYEEILSSVLDAAKQVERNNELHRIMRMQETKGQLQNDLLDDCFRQYLQNPENSEPYYNRLMQIAFDTRAKNNEEHHRLFLCLIDVISWKEENTWNDLLLRSTFSNIFSELFQGIGKTIIIRIKDLQYALLLYFEHGTVDIEWISTKLQHYSDFESRNMPFKTAVYCMKHPVSQVSIRPCFRKLVSMSENNIKKSSGFFICEKEAPDITPLYRLEMNRWEDYLLQDQGDRIVEKIEAYFDKQNDVQIGDAKTLKHIYSIFLSSYLAFLTEKRISYRNAFNESYSIDHLFSMDDNYEHLMEAVKSCIASAHRIVSGDDTEKTSYDPVYCAIDYIHRNIEKNITREDVSAYIHMNTDYFSRIFKNQVGRTVKDYIIDVKMDAAKKLLSSTDLPVNIIAVKTGFSSLSWFSQVFRKQIGLTPMEFRNNSKSDL